MAITLADLRKAEKDPLTKGFYDIFLMRNEMASIIPVQKTTALRQRMVRYASLPTPTWRQLGAYYSASQGSTDWLEETVYDVGQYVDVDELIDMDTSAFQNVRSVQTKLASEALAYEFNNVLVNGVVASDQPDGIDARVAQLATAQKVDGASVDISTAGSASSFNQFLDNMDQLLYSIDNGKDFNDVVLLGNDNLMLRLWSTLRRLGLMDTTKDQWGREVRTYKGARLLDIGVKSDQTTKIIPTTSNLTTLYAAKLGEEFFSCVQMRPLKVTDLGRQPGTANLRTEIKWTFGFSMPHPRGLARLSNIKVA